MISLGPMNCAVVLVALASAACRRRDSGSACRRDLVLRRIAVERPDLLQGRAARFEHRRERLEGVAARRRRRRRRSAACRPTSPSDGDDHWPWNSRRADLLVVVATSRPVCLSSTIRLGAVGQRHALVRPVDAVGRADVDAGRRGPAPSNSRRPAASTPSLADHVVRPEDVGIGRAERDRLLARPGHVLRPRRRTARRCRWPCPSTSRQTTSQRLVTR